MNGSLKVSEIAELWGVSERQVQIFCKDDNIEGAKKFGVAWDIAENTPKPTRTNKYKPGPKPTCRNERIMFSPEMEAVD